MFAADNVYDSLQAFATSLAIGLLIGLERERHTDVKAGLRTFALVGLLGCLAALLSQATDSGWVLAAGILAVGAMMIAAHATDPLDDGDPGTTSVIALLVCYALGATVWYGYMTQAVMLAITTMGLLYFKTQLHGMTKSMTHKDVLSILQFAVLSFVILPILPDRDFGPYAAFNPHQIWWLVVLISGLSLAGYTALRFVGARHGAPLIGIFGGLASSTATTMVFARHTRNDPSLARTAMVVILLANLLVMVRLLMVSFVVAPTLVPSLAVVFGSAFVLGFGVTLWGWHQLSRGDALPMPEVHNPTEIKAALTFGALYALVLLLSAWLQDAVGNKGLYLIALASGLTDVDAVVLSTLRLFGMEKVGNHEAVVAITLAVLSNLAFKLGLVVVIGGRALALRAGPGMAAIAIGLIGALVLGA